MNNMRCAFFNGFPSFLVGECVISFLDDIITIEDITDLDEESAARWQHLKQG
jgi:uncharacterized protein YerC|tara:strand:- start:23 stop:178 length:156 start_codon:yes stop_codon:yes gene_type:complete